MVSVSLLHGYLTSIPVVLKEVKLAQFYLEWRLKKVKKLRETYLGDHFPTYV